MKSIFIAGGLAAVLAAFSLYYFAGEKLAPASAAKEENRLPKFYQEESRKGGRDSKEHLEALAPTLNQTEIDWLGQKMAEEKSEPDLRNFSIVLLGLSQKEAALASLSAFALSPPKNKLEWKLRELAIAGIARGCANANKDALLDVVEKQAQDELRTQAHLALRKCSTK